MKCFGETGTLRFIGILMAVYQLAFCQFKCVLWLLGLIILLIYNVRLTVLCLKMIWSVWNMYWYFYHLFLNPVFLWPFSSDMWFGRLTNLAGMWTFNRYLHIFKLYLNAPHFVLYKICYVWRAPGSRCYITILQEKT